MVMTSNKYSDLFHDKNEPYLTLEETLLNTKMLLAYVTNVVYDVRRTCELQRLENAYL